ncbi:MAG: hypothetical protein SAK29_36870 [Scytonema sp. PMC 1069.18]|nr:hypothetical protein [Scytonema sp. PMC 1069.18]MEC4880048.1 hypothetical protein [Scytonema sp. PMC 1070.18]
MDEIEILQNIPSQSPLGRVGDAVNSIPGTDNTSTGGDGSNQFAGGDTPMSPFDQIRYNIDQAIYNAFPPGGGTPDPNTSIDTSGLNPFNQPPGGSQSDSNVVTQTGSGESPSFGGYNPFDPGMGGYFSDPMANQIDATRADLTEDVTALVNDGNVDANVVAGRISTGVNDLVYSYTNSTSADNASATVVASTPIPAAETVSESVFPQTSASYSVLTPVTASVNADYTTDYESFLKNVDSDDLSIFADLISEYGNVEGDDDLTKVTNFLNEVYADAGKELSDRTLTTDVWNSVNTSNFEDLLRLGINDNLPEQAQVYFDQFINTVSSYRNIFQGLVDDSNQSGSDITIA